MKSDFLEKYQPITIFGRVNKWFKSIGLKGGNKTEYNPDPDHHRDIITGETFIDPIVLDSGGSVEKEQAIK